MIIAFSYGVWCYSTNIEVYAPSILFSLLVLLRLSRKELSHNDILAISGLHILAILFHQVNVLLTPVIILYIIRGRDVKWRAIILYLIPTAFIVLASYIFAAWFYADERSFNGITKWTLFYATELDYWHPFSFDTFPYVVTGLGHAFIGAHFVFRISSLSNKLTGGMSEHSLSDELYLSLFFE